MAIIGSTMILLMREPPTVPVYDVNGEVVEEIKLPKVFGLPVRKDLIRRAFHSEFTARLQPKGRDPMAGKRTSARSFGVGLGIARVPRIPGTGRAAFIPSAVGGRLAFPPSPLKKLHEEINRKEKKLATASALAATAMPEFVRARGHVFEAKAVPVVVVDEVEEAIRSAAEARRFLQKIGLWPDIERAHEKTRQRAGKGKRRGRRYVTPKSILFVLMNHLSPFARAVANFPGVDIAEPSYVNVLLLAPGGHPGRLMLVTKSALEELGRRFEVNAP